MNNIMTVSKFTSSRPLKLPSSTILHTFLIFLKFLLNEYFPFSCLFVSFAKRYLYSHILKLFSITEKFGFFSYFIQNILSIKMLGKPSFFFFTFIIYSTRRCLSHRIWKKDSNTISVNFFAHFWKENGFFQAKTRDYLWFFAYTVWGTDTVVPFSDRRQEMSKVVSSFCLKENHSFSENKQKKNQHW